MHTRMVAFLLGLSQRERWLLAGLFGVIMPLAAIFLLIMPLRESHAQTQADLQSAQNLHQWVTTMVAQDAALRLMEPTAQATPTVAIGISGIEESLIRAGLRPVVTQLARGDDGAVALRLESVDYTQLTNWLDATQPNWGYDIESFRLESSDRAGLVSAEFALELAQ